MIHSILTIEDDKDLREYLRDILLSNGYSVYPLADGSKALEVIEKKQPNLVILDLGLPTVGGETVCSEIKKSYPDIPVIILTAKDSVSDVVKGLNLGADDYVKKPFETEELIARIKTRLRKQDGADTILKVADLELNTKTIQVKRSNKLIALTPQEFKVLHYLMSNKGRVLSREMILSRIWLASPDVETRVVDVYVGYLRKKIDSKYRNKLIHSVRGFGYILKE